MLQSKHKKRRFIAVCILALIFSIILGSVYAYPAIRTWAQGEKIPPVGTVPIDPVIEPPVPPAPPAPPAPPEPYVHPKVRGVYVSAWIAATPHLLDPLLEWIEETELNGVVIDVKDDLGMIPWRTEVPMAVQYKAFDSRLRNIDILMERLEDAGIYPIARLVTFKDTAIAEARPDLAVKNRITGGIWKDRRGSAWLDPHNKESWRYIVAVAKEAAAKGFKEIQFDYVRFPSDGVMSAILYPHATGQERSEVIAEFLAYAKSELEPLGVRVGADIFGLATVVKTNDLGIGHVLEDIYSVVDVVSPMVYPEHYAAGTFGIPDPDKEPYLTVLKSLEAAHERLLEHPNADNIVMRPWLQDFSLRHTYGVVEIREQIRAVYDAGFEEWILWDPRCRYTKQAFPLGER